MAIQLRRGNQADLVSEQLLPGEPAYALDTKRLVIGDGEGDATLIPTDEEVRNQVDDIVNSRFASKMNLGTTLYHNPNGLQITAGMNIPLNDSTSKYTHLLFDMYAGEGTGKRLHITEASGEIVFTATNLVNAPSSSTYHAIFEAVLQVSTNSISVTSFRRVAVSSGSTYTPSYDENVTAASWTIYRIIGLQLYADVDGGPAETYLSQLIAQTQDARDSANTAAGNAQDIADTVQQKLDNGEFKGEKGDPGEVTLEQLAETNLRIATINKSLSDYQNAIASINPNQEAKQTASGYGTVSLPVNAANGQVSVSVKGLTATNLIKNGNFAIDSNEDGIADEWFNSSTNSENFRVENNAQYWTALTNTWSGSIHQKNVPNVQSHKYYIAFYNKNVHQLFWTTLQSITSSNVPNGFYSLIFTSNIESSVVDIFFYGKTVEGDESYIKNVILIDLTATFGAGNEPTVEQCDLMFPYWFDGTKSTISAGRLVSENADETERTEMYIPDVGVLRSVGDVRDEIVGGEHIKRIDDDGETVLAEPIVTPVNVTGTLVGHPNGTIYFEPVLPVAGVYTASGIEVTDTDFPIDYIEKIAKIDFITGVETEVDVSQAVIAGDGLSFTHPDLIDGDIVFFTYFHGIEGTQPKIDVEYYDSRYTVKDSETEQFYRWKVTVTNGTPTLSVEVV